MSEEKYNIDEYPIEEKLEEVMKLNQEQVKIIEDLQQKVEQLEKENEELKYLVDDSNIIKAFIAEHNKAEQLENIRKEAIEYIKSDSCFDGSIICEKDLLNILNKGDNKE